MSEDVPREIIDRRMRVHLMSSLAQAAEATDLQGLLEADWMDNVADSIEEWGPNEAITGEEAEAVSRLYHRWKDLRAEEASILRERSGGKVVHHYRDEDLLKSLKWFEQVHPLARDAYSVFLKRGWLAEGIWDEA